MIGHRFIAKTTPSSACRRGDNPLCSCDNQGIGAAQPASSAIRLHAIGFQENTVSRAESPQPALVKLFPAICQHPQAREGIPLILTGK